MVSAHGKPFRASHAFYIWFRKAGATIAANAGASPHKLMSMFGWSKMAMAELYTREVDSKKPAYKTAKMIADNTSIG
ncbi:hypothetical protein C0030_004095 [Candidatus Liberibacter solanacearum]|uniref:Integrase n=1 Tax=Candidatus Liberibacter solanacearum TaxID=556287 RepID=A0A424FLX4_9HYPH|nr:hypothetical protein [Candidatus Liberibacter solanacearum]RPD37121.1 hypothetical protein C0030_004095 [Candidatus Liberibacter solanacearum]